MACIHGFTVDTCGYCSGLVKKTVFDISTVLSAKQIKNLKDSWEEEPEEEKEEEQEEEEGGEEAIEDEVE